MDIVPLILTYILGILSPVLLEHFPLYVEEHYSRESPVQMTGHTGAQEERRRGKLLVLLLPAWLSRQTSDFV